MSLIVEIVGILTCAALVLISLCAVVGTLTDRQEKIRDWRRHENEQNLNNRLLNDSWWFSEHTPTMNAMQSLAKGRSVDTVRETWRREMKEQP